MKTVSSFRAADPKGTMTCSIQGKSVPAVHPFVCPLPPLSQPAIVGLWMDGQADGRMDGREDGRTDFPCILQDIVRFGSAALPSSKLPLLY